MPTKLQTEIPQYYPPEADFLLERELAQLNRLGRDAQSDSRLLVEIAFVDLMAQSTATILRQPEIGVELGLDAQQMKAGNYTWELTRTGTDGGTASQLFVVGETVSGRRYQVDAEHKVVGRKNLEVDELSQLFEDVKFWANHDLVKKHKQELWDQQQSLYDRNWGSLNEEAIKEQTKKIGFGPYQMFEPLIYIDTGRDMGFGSGYEQPLEEIIDLMSNYDIIKAASAEADELLRAQPPLSDHKVDVDYQDRLGKIEHLRKVAGRIGEVNVMIRRAYEAVFKQFFAATDDNIYRLGNHDYALYTYPNGTRAFVREDRDGSQVEYVHYSGTMPQGELKRHNATTADYSLFFEEVYSAAA